MAAYGTNNVNTQVGGRTLFPDVKYFTNSSISYNQGDLLIFDTANNVVRAASAESECASFLGIAALDVVNGYPRSPYSTQVDGSQGIVAIPGPQYGDTFNMVLQTGSTLAPGAAIYGKPVAVGVEPNTLVAATGTYQIGIYQGGAITSSAAGTMIEVLIGARWPAAASGAQFLKF